MADLNREELQRLARLGAKSRLEEIQREEAAIRRAFPDLFGGRRRGGRAKRAASAASRAGRAAKKGRRRRRRGTMSAAARKAVSERMKKYWASRRKAGK
ncbi:MAG TPA: hypothetical protein VKD69_10485 [Vicinamibacterales bacterium]|nr:hypothetical protein [Vicinamibacterales bacterium]